MDKFFDPNAVAVVGASTKPGKIGYEVLRTLEGFVRHSLWRSRHQKIE